MTQGNSIGTTINGKVIAPTQIQYDTLQGKILNAKGSGFKGIDAGAETAETRDIFILPNIDREFLSKTYRGDRTGENWEFDTGKTDSNDIFLIDSKVDIMKVAQFADCIWYNPDWQGDPLIDTRGMDKYKDYAFGSDYNSFEMAYYRGWERIAPTPSQFGLIDLSKINLNAIQGMSDDDFIRTYKFSITVFSGSTTTLARQYSHLTLTGTSAINGTGNASANTLIGNSADNILSGLKSNDTIIGGDGADIIIGGAGGDNLNGGAGKDTFKLALADSRLANYDKITNFAIGTDRLDGPTAVTAANLRELGTVTALTQKGISAVLTTATFVRKGAATFSFVDGGATRTFLALNNDTAGFQAASDAIVEISGYSGTLTSLAII